MTHRLAVLVLVLGCLVGACGGEPAGDEAVAGLLAVDPEDPRATADWWRRAVGTIGSEEGDGALLDRVRSVWEAVRRETGDPGASLVLLESSGDGAPRAFTLADGTVLLDRSALELCLAGRPRAEGDHLLALVLGHELDHLVHDDFWHLRVVVGERRLAADPGGDGLELGRLLDRDAARSFTGQELRADDRGVMAAILAGHAPPPSVEVEALYRDFFAAWETGPVGRALAGAPHPDAEDRAAFLARRLHELAPLAEDYRRAVDAVEAGRLDEAEALLGRLRTAERFPSREVLGTLGLVHALRATRRLARCDGSLVTRWALPTVLDRETRAEVRFLRGPTRSPCFQDERFLAHAEEAEDLYRAALDRDPAYLPARINLLSLLVLWEQGLRARAEVEAARRELPDALADDPRLALVDVLGRYLDVPRRRGADGQESIDCALADLDRLEAELERRGRAEALPELPWARARLLTEAGRFYETAPAWSRFATLAPDHPLADHARAEAERARAGR